MTNEELKNIWAQNTSMAQPTSISPEIVWRLAKASERFERSIFWRDTREWLATFLVAGFFLFAAFSQRTIHWLPVLAAILACLPMTYVVFLRQQRPAPKSSSRLIDHLRESIARVQHQIGLLRSVLWWYLMPLALSLVLIFIDRLYWGRVYFDVSILFSSSIVIAVFFGVWMLNQRAVRNDLEPRLRELERTLRELETQDVDPQNT